GSGSRMTSMAIPADDSAAPASRSSGRSEPSSCGEQFLGDAFDVGSLDLALVSLHDVAHQPPHLLPLDDAKRAVPSAPDRPGHIDSTYWRCHGMSICSNSSAARSSSVRARSCSPLARSKRAWLTMLMAACGRMPLSSCRRIADSM